MVDFGPFRSNSAITRHEAPFTLPWADSDDPGLSGYPHHAFCTLRVPDYDKTWTLVTEIDPGIFLISRLREIKPLGQRASTARI